MNFNLQSTIVYKGVRSPYIRPSAPIPFLSSPCSDIFPPRPSPSGSSIGSSPSSRPAYIHDRLYSCESPISPGWEFDPEDGIFSTREYAMSSTRSPVYSSVFQAYNSYEYIEEDTDTDSYSESDSDSEAQYITINPGSPWYKSPSPTPSVCSSAPEFDTSLRPAPVFEVDIAAAMHTLLVDAFYNDIDRVIPKDVDYDFDHDGCFGDLEPELLAYPHETFNRVCWDDAISSRSPTLSKPLPDVPIDLEPDEEIEIEWNEENELSIQAGHLEDVYLHDGIQKTKRNIFNDLARSLFSPRH